MKAAYLNQFGGSEQIKIGVLPEPKLTAGEVLLRVIATPVNHVDTFVASGSFATEVDFPFIIGRDAVGEIIAVNSDSHFKVGELVWTNSMGYDGRKGVASQFALVPETRLFSVPAGVDPLQLIASVHSSATASILLKKLGAQTGETILIEGAAGHVGTKLVQIARSLGLTVITTSAPRDYTKLRKLGASQLFDYRADYMKKIVSSVDYVVDTSGKVTLADNLSVLANHGKVALITAPETNQFNLPVREFYTKSQQIIGFVISRASLAELQVAGQQLNRLFAEGRLLDDELLLLPLEKAPWAYQTLVDGRAHKKRLILQPNL